MAHVARINAFGVVEDVNVINNSDLPNNGDFSPETEKAAQDLQESLGLTPQGHKWLLCSYNENFRGIFPGVGHYYDEELDIFIDDSPERPELYDSPRDPSLIAE